MAVLALQRLVAMRTNAAIGTIEFPTIDMAAPPERIVADITILRLPRAGEQPRNHGYKANDDKQQNKKAKRDEGMSDSEPKRKNHHDQTYQ